ncbi:MAG TPA: cupin domain-containing protein [Dehalococcoidia bacterium]|jgi:mannose-6-phosphate isomerase-like protein (cupin superfamily)
MARKLRVRNWREAEERLARGQLKVRRVFDAAEGGFESGFSFAQYNYLQPGEANETHIHDDIEKVYYVIQGECLVKCGDDEAVAKAGDFFFLPVLVDHSVTNVGQDEVQMVVFAARVPGAK